MLHQQVGGQGQDQHRAGPQGPHHEVGVARPLEGAQGGSQHPGFPGELVYGYALLPGRSVEEASLISLPVEIAKGDRGKVLKR